MVLKGQNEPLFGAIPLEDMPAGCTLFTHRQEFRMTPISLHKMHPKVSQKDFIIKIETMTNSN